MMNRFEESLINLIKDIGKGIVEYAHANRKLHSSSVC